MIKYCLHLLNLYLLLIYSLKIFAKNADEGYFWQLTDVHLDANYTNHPSCIGKLGNYLCDSPWNLVNYSVNEMFKINPNPDFILWTGDSIAHCNDSDIDDIKISALISNVSKLLNTVFSNVKIFPLLGNHDSWPANQIPGDSNDPYFNMMLTDTGWFKWIQKDSLTSFLKGGYYSVELNNNLILLGINSNVWYSLNNLTGQLTDPLDQFQWLEQVMQEARNQKKMVILMGHIPPGMFGRAEGTSWMRPSFNQQFISFLERYADVISAAVFGHEHTDGFKLIFDEETALFPLFMAPSLTPWLSPIPFVGSNNPALRLYKYSRKSGSLLDYIQFYLNLEDPNPEWKLEYSFKDAYQVSSLSAREMQRLYKSLECDEPLFDKYYEYNSVNKEKERCEAQFRRAHLCSIRHVSYDEYNKCVHDERKLNYSMSTRCLEERHRHEVARETYILLVILIILVVILFVLVTICFRNRRPRIPYTPILA